jgi:hemerythrin superfamily protein
MDKKSTNEASEVKDDRKIIHRFGGNMLTKLRDNLIPERFRKFTSREL